MEDIFKHMNATYKGLESRLKAEGFKARVLQVLKAWDEWLVYDRDYLSRLRSTFLGITNVSEIAHANPVFKYCLNKKNFLAAANDRQSRKRHPNRNHCSARTAKRTTKTWTASHWTVRRC